MKKLLITGCGRSGTSFIAKVLRHVGLNATHETLFGLYRHTWPPQREGAEASWLAVPYLEKLPEDVTVFQQIRNPLDVARSLIGFNFFGRPQSLPFREFLFRHEPSIKTWSDPLDRSLAYWINWNIRVQEHAQVQYRLESLTAVDLADFLRIAGFDVPASKLSRAFRDTGPRYNHRPRAKLPSATILERKLGPNLEKLAYSYGYTTLS